MHFYFDITLQFLIKKKDSKLDCYLLYMYTNFLFVYPASSVGKRFTSTKEVNIFLKQVSINICKTLDWVSVISPLFSCYFGLFNQGYLNSSYPPRTACGVKKTKTTERSAHKAVIKHLSEQTKHHAPEEEKIVLWLSFLLILPSGDA